MRWAICRARTTEPASRGDSSALESLRFFEAAARQQSFARAAEELGVTPAAVAHRVRMLEKHLDVPLFDRQAESPERCCLITTAAARQRPEVRAFRQWVLDEARNAAAVNGPAPSSAYGQER